MKKLILMLMLMAPLATFAQKFGKVNTNTIMQTLPEISKINGELEATAKQYENELKAMQDELQRQAEAYDKGKSTMNATAQKKQGARVAAALPKVPTDTGGQSKSPSEGTARQDAAHHQQSAQRHRECWQGWRLHLYL